MLKYVVMLQDILIGEFYPMFVASHFVTEEDMKGRGSNKIGTQKLFYLESKEKNILLSKS